MLCLRKERNWRGRRERNGLSIHKTTVIIQTQIIGSWCIVISLIGLDHDFRVSVGRERMWEIVYNTLTKIRSILNLVIKIKLIENITRFHLMIDDILMNGKEFLSLHIRNNICLPYNISII